MKTVVPGKQGASRAGFTALEITIVLGILGVVMTLVAELAAWTLAERTRSAARLDALETANNLLESARALPWESLTAQWAAAQRLPDSLAQRLVDAQLTVGVEPDASHPRSKRVTVEIRWVKRQGGPEAPIRLVALFSDRSAPGTGGKP